MFASGTAGRYEPMRVRTFTAESVFVTEGGTRAYKVGRKLGLIVAPKSVA